MFKLLNYMYNIFSTTHTHARVFSLPTLFAMLRRLGAIISSLTGGSGCTNEDEGNSFFSLPSGGSGCSNDEDDHTFQMEGAVLPSFRGERDVPGNLPSQKVADADLAAMQAAVEAAIDKAAQAAQAAQPAADVAPDAQAAQAAPECPNQ